MTITRKNIVLMAICCVVVAGVLFAVYHRTQPANVQQAQKATDAAVRSAETALVSADSVITRTYETARKKVAEQNAEIRKNVKNLDGDAVAHELTALLDEYRRERDGGG